MNKSSRTVLTFKGGIAPEGNGKDMSSAIPTRTAPLLERYRVLLQENAGKPPKPVVAKGDKVKKYQLIAAADGFVSANLHSPTSGEVAGIVKVPGPMGIMADALEIVSDGEDAGDPPFAPLDWQKASPQELLARVNYELPPGELPSAADAAAVKCPTHALLSDKAHFRIEQNEEGINE